MDNNEKICRICLKTEMQQEFSRIFSKSNEIALKLNLISGIKIIDLTDHTGPSLICPACLKELYQCFLFRKKCQSADEYFRTKMAKIETQLWNEIDFASDFVNTKLESLRCESNSFVMDLQEEEIFDQQLKDEDNAVGFEEFSVLIQKSKPMAFRRRRRIEQPAAKTTRLKKNSLECSYCGLILSRRNRRIEHERLHLLEKSQQFYECFFCGKFFNQKLGLIPHFQKSHCYSKGPKERWKCAICEDKVLPPGNLAVHYEKEHPSFISNSRFISKNSGITALNAPIRTEIKKPSRKRESLKLSKPPPNFWPCSICGNSFTNYQRYQKHLKEIHEVHGFEIIEDSAAIKHFVPGNDTTIKMEKCDEARKFPCTTCGKVFASVMTVRAHEKTHLNVEYLCDLCGSSFRVKAYLTAHVQKVHMKLKKFKCSIENCSASFVHRELLNYHVRKHLNIRNFSCRYCGKTFVTRSCCKIHERIHTDERPYSCKFCERTFIHHSDHRRHEIKHSGIEIFTTEKHSRAENFNVIDP